MDNTISKVLELTVQKQMNNPEFGNDLVNYLKLIAVQECPEERIDELRKMVEENKVDIKQFYYFVASFVPDLSKKIIDYIEAY